ncbi:NAD-dependent epimerase/dehydratase family protein [Blastopirellula marina]|uniref:NAD-dependent epimerase/dehydratase family protein/3-betahydroxysteroid dehydrogenase/isomerase family protein n=1 Tax=Blastopirellula marina DSM 3645 TaxID=314230 RepID=A3ZLP8_9BACT|nr:NAD-dependent epimerase/dehydratase family protein [Blastopirellula marina]EAQ82681.1 NAD-dependent epimerase/dehydratase family protein/3-betahydroxysteroid dehydrogenase/isomerase family protein [Blastopirellula marina DSM 3645]
MAKYFVTGATGFIGRYLCRRLVADGHSLRCAVRQTSATEPLEQLGVELVEVDLSNPHDLEQAIEGCEAIFHVAGLICATAPEKLFHVNRDGTRRIVEAAAAQTNPPTVLYISSLAAVGPSRTEHKKRPDHFPKPVSNYGRSKRAGERQAELVADRVPITIVRPSIVFGGENREMLPMFQAIHRFGVHPMPSAELRLSLIHVDDLIELMLIALAAGMRIRARREANAKYDGVGYYFAADEDQPTYEELGGLLGQALGVDNVRTQEMPKLALWTTATLSELAGNAIGHPSILNRDKIREATAGDWICDITNTQEQLGFSPARSLQDRLRQTADWYREAGWL